MREMNLHVNRATRRRGVVIVFTLTVRVGYTTRRSKFSNGVVIVFTLTVRGGLYDRAVVRF
jgi:hypothetical protein